MRVRDPKVLAVETSEKSGPPDGPGISDARRRGAELRCTPLRSRSCLSGAGASEWKWQDNSGSVNKKPGP